MTPSVCRPCPPTGPLSAFLLPQDTEGHPTPLVSMELLGISERPQNRQQVGKSWTPVPGDSILALD